MDAAVTITAVRAAYWRPYLASVNSSSKTVIVCRATYAAALYESSSASAVGTLPKTINIQAFDIVRSKQTMSKVRRHHKYNALYIIIIPPENHPILLVPPSVIFYIKTYTKAKTSPPSLQAASPQERSVFAYGPPRRSRHTRSSSPSASPPTSHIQRNNPSMCTCDLKVDENISPQNPSRTFGFEKNDSPLLLSCL